METKPRTYLIHVSRGWDETNRWKTIPLDDCRLDRSSFPTCGLRLSTSFFFLLARASVGRQGLAAADRGRGRGRGGLMGGRGRLDKRARMVFLLSFSVSPFRPLSSHFSFFSLFLFLSCFFILLLYFCYLYRFFLLLLFCTVLIFLLIFLFLSFYKFRFFPVPFFCFLFRFFPFTYSGFFLFLFFSSFLFFSFYLLGFLLLLLFPSPYSLSFRVSHSLIHRHLSSPTHPHFLTTRSPLSHKHSPLR